MEKMMGTGELPHFSWLAGKGVSHPLETVAPPQSPVVWTTIATGVNPSQHGVHDFLTRDPGVYTPKLSILRQGKLGYRRPYSTKTFWEIASERGIPATIIKWPLTFPANPMLGAMLTGLGTPDIRGTLGRYTFFTSADVPEPEKKKGAMVKVDVAGGAITTYLTGPMSFSFQGKVETTTPLEIELGDGRIRCRLDGASFTLEEGRWSAWVPVPFKVGFLRTVTGMCRFYLKSVKPEFNLYATPVNLSNQMKFMPVSYPLGYGQQLADAVGPYATLGIAEDANALNDEIIDERAFLSGCDLVMAEREKIFFHELSRFHQGILACVFDTTDRVQHMFWRYLDGGHPRHDPQEAQEYASVVPSVYQRMDGILGKVSGRLDSDTLLIVCSDHGFTSFRRSVHLNTWLVHNGFMVLKEGKAAGTPLFADVDWPRTAAFAFGLNSLFLNVKNREPQGCLNGDGLAAVKEELAMQLRTMTDGGISVIKEVCDPVELYGLGDGMAPDLIIGYNMGYRASWQTALGEAPAGAFTEDNLGKWSGDHCCAPQLVPGIFLSNQRTLLAKPHVKDICPAILDYLGL
jgi:predicted AlkP superfamily phosphohydrolase/phosphomutase